MLLLLNTNWLNEHTTAILNIALLGAPFSAFLVIPYALVGRCAKATDGAGKVAHASFTRPCVAHVRAGVMPAQPHACPHARARR